MTSKNKLYYPVANSIEIL